MSRAHGRALLPAAALSACALGCWLSGAAVGALAAQTGTTRAELSATAVVRTSVAAGTWGTSPARSASAAPSSTAAAPTETPTATPTATAAPSSTATAAPTSTTTSATSPSATADAETGTSSSSSSTP